MDSLDWIVDLVLIHQPMVFYWHQKESLDSNEVAESTLMWLELYFAVIQFELVFSNSIQCLFVLLVFS